jgi:hypothetical protein
MKRTKARLVIGSSLILATTIAFIVSDYFGQQYKPEPPYLTATSPERLPPDPTKPNGAEVRYTDVHVYSLVGGGHQEPEKE